MIVTGPVRSKNAFNLATCQAGDAVGDLVRIAGAVVGGTYVVTRADPSDTSKMPVIGTLVQKLSATSGIIQKQGLVYFGGLPSLTPGKLVFAGLDGKATEVPPSAGASITGFASVQIIGVAVDADKVELVINPNFVKTRS